MIQKLNLNPNPNGKIGKYYLKCITCQEISEYKEQIWLLEIWLANKTLIEQSYLIFNEVICYGWELTNYTEGYMFHFYIKHIKHELVLSDTEY